MQFKEVIGQHEAKNKLRGMVQSGKVPHAMMLLGPEGNGNLGMALSLAQYIQCENRTDEDSCGTCSSCQKNQKFIHPDVYFTYPVVSRKSGEPPISTDYITEWRSALADNFYMNANDWLQNIGAENRQGNITVRECHEVIKRMGLKTYESTYKIQIIWLAEYLKEAGNTLLKIIEEPTENTIFILVVENIDMVLNTVISRTQIIKINAIDDADVQQALSERYDMDAEAAKRIARISDGNFNAAMTWASGTAMRARSAREMRCLGMGEHQLMDVLMKCEHHICLFIVTFLGLQQGLPTPTNPLGKVLMGPSEKTRKCPPPGRPSRPPQRPARRRCGSRRGWCRSRSRRDRRRLLAQYWRFSRPPSARIIWARR